MSRVRRDVGTKVGTATPGSSSLVINSRVSAINGMRVFDVGQGDCIGLLDQNNDVFCYVDYGGLFNHPDRRRPGNTPKRLSITYASGNVSIVLTHWDKDHYYSAYQKNIAAQKCPWLVPRQWAAPFAVRFAARLNRARCWPESVGAKAYRFTVGKQAIEIHKCQPFKKGLRKQDRNTHGLAIALVDSSRGTSKARMMLMAGDCHFDGVPSWPSHPIRALVAYHHGSDTGWTGKTTGAISNTAPSIDMAYSFGKNNSYGHPVRQKYRPTWHSNSAETPNLRSKGVAYIDFKW